MVELNKQIAKLNEHTGELLNKYDGALNDIKDLSEQKRTELEKYISEKIKEIKQDNQDIDKIKKEIDDKINEVSKEIGHAKTADSAKVADVAHTADSADHAKNADSANSAINADNAKKLNGKTLEEIKKDFVIKVNKNIITLNTTLESLKDLGLNCKEISKTFYKDGSKGVGWGTNDNKWKWLKIPVPNGSTQIRIIFSGRYDGRGLGYLNIENDNNKCLLSLHDAWTNASEGQSLYINGKEIMHKKTKNLENYTTIVNLNGSSYIKIGMTGYTSSYPYNKRFIRSLIFN